jgi:quinone-modifying oxidoreductase subunit QmoA
VEKVDGTPGNYDVSLKINPRYVNENCTCCGACAEACQTEVADDYNFGMCKIKGAYLPFEMAFPAKFVISPPDYRHRRRCQGQRGVQIRRGRPRHAGQTVNLPVGAIVWATGWEPYDAHRIDNLGFGQYDNIITNMMMERLASQSGPTQGKIVRPSDDKAPESVAFVQCAGSRDENHLPYCSYICCMAS